ncbi:hypothetical protein [Orrella sp. 11846]|uniref:hypothetical protein n=1 Tax=Orrella sp. 11846 TaxID=3409913 RepID=UPI003B5C481B
MVEAVRAHRMMCEEPDVVHVVETEPLNGRENVILAEADFFVEFSDAIAEGSLGPSTVIMTTLNIDTAGIGPGKITDQFFERRWILERVNLQDRNQRLHFGFEASRGNLFASLSAAFAKTTSQVTSPVP